ncbi:MAG: SURF1 family cytochrome oxidase biogenesis protein [Nocardioides sp.]
MRSWAFLLSRRWVVFALVVCLLSYLAWWLGEWQFRRLSDRLERNEILQRNVSAAPRDVATVLSADRALRATDEWRTVRAIGRYDTERTVIVRYRTREGTSGVDVVVPFVLAGGGAVIVNRGWFRTPNTARTDRTLASVPDPPAGQVRLTGWARRDGTGSSTGVRDRSTRAISSRRIASATGLDLLRGFVVLDRESPESDDPLAPESPPDPGRGPHFFYGLQWWFFGALAVFGFGYLAYDERRGGRRRSRVD